ncbi:ABC transporter ATP-binding protein [Tistrella sp. BH-R2-4]|uniref:ABC transporter ATP-binding protein n=2 Tax=Geminicoccaceae TaxID=2066434 RepID=A0ABU9YRL4_9PROT
MTMTPSAAPSSAAPPTASPTQPVLSIRDLSVALPAGGDRTHAVRGLSLDIARREIVCIVGESGSGKSVTASAVMGLLPPGTLAIDEGSITLEGEDITHATPARMRALRGNRMAMVFQEPMTALNPLMTVGNQIAEAIRVHRGDMSAAEIRARVQVLMTDVRLPDPERMIGAYPHQMSGGQRQRVMIAMALALEPALIIADEPTTALDITTQAQILHLLRALQDHHDSGILFITHDFGVVREIADRVLVMRHGEVVEAGPAAQVLEAPAHPYTRMLLDAVPAGDVKPADTVRRAPLIEVEHLELVYGGRSLFGGGRAVRAVDDLSFTLGEGETLAVVGESGSGKSTVGRCLTGFNTPTGGRILYRGRDIAGLRGRALQSYRRGIQMIFQDPYRSLNPRRRILDTLIEGPVQHGVRRADAVARAAGLVEMVGLSADAFDRYPHEFSGGQRQRICIARALAMEPEVIVADEAVSALDVSVQAQVLELIDDLQQRLGFAMVFITHDLRVAAAIADRIAVMQRGRLVECGPVGEVFLKPRAAYTRELLAAIPGGALGDAATAAAS